MPAQDGGGEGRRKAGGDDTGEGRGHRQGHVTPPDAQGKVVFQKRAVL